MQDLSTVLTAIETRLAAIESKLDKLIPQEPATTTHTATRIEKYTSSSGNTTWKAFTTDDTIIYLRQAHKQMLVDAGLWNEINRLDYDVVADCKLTIKTVPDGDFLKPVSITGDIPFPFAMTGDDPGDIPFDAAQADDPLTAAYKSGSFIILDTETATLHGEVIQLSIIDPNGNTLLDTLLKPKEIISPQATAVHGITNEMVADAPTFADMAEKLFTILSPEITIIGWNATYDRNCLIHTAKQHGVPMLAEFIKARTTWVDAMEPFAAIYGDWSDYHKSYTFQKLTTAARYYNIPTDDAHTALADCLMTLNVVKEMIS